MLVVISFFFFCLFLFFFCKNTNVKFNTCMLSHNRQQPFSSRLWSASPNMVISYSLHPCCLHNSLWIDLMMFSSKVTWLSNYHCSNLLLFFFQIWNPLSVCEMAVTVLKHEELFCFIFTTQAQVLSPSCENIFPCQWNIRIEPSNSALAAFDPAGWGWVELNTWQCCLTANIYTTSVHPLLFSTLCVYTVFSHLLCPRCG